MKIKLTFLFLFFLCSNYCLIFSQNSTKIPNQKKGRFYTTEGYEVKFKSLKEYKSTLLYKDKKGNISTINKDEVLRIDAQTGNEALKWGAVSFGLGIFSNAIGIINVKQRSKNSKTKINDKPLYIAAASTTTALTLFGALLGASKRKYHTIFDNPTYSSKFKNWNINATSINNQPALGFTFRF